MPRGLHRSLLHARRAFVEFLANPQLAQGGKSNGLKRAIGRARKHVADRNAQRLMATPIARAVSRPLSLSCHSSLILSRFAGSLVGRRLGRIGMPHHQDVATLTQRLNERRTRWFICPRGTDGYHQEKYRGQWNEPPTWMSCDNGAPFRFGFSRPISLPASSVNFCGLASFS